MPSPTPSRSGGCRHDLEQVVAIASTSWLDRADGSAASLAPDLDAADYASIGRAARRLATNVRDGDPAERRDAVRALVGRVDVGDAAIAVTLRWSALVDDAHPLAPATAAIAAPVSKIRRGTDVRLIIGGGDAAANRDPRLVELMVEARIAQERLAASSAASLDELAAACGHSRKHLSRLLRLATLAPDIVAAILDGRQPAQLSRIALLEADDLPVDWAGQRERFGFTAVG